MRRRAAVILGFVTFCGALAGFLVLGSAAQNGEIRVLISSHTIVAGEVLQASTGDLGSGGMLVHLSAAAEQDAIPEASFREVQGAVALVTIPKGALILRHDLAFGSGSSLRRLTLDLSFMPPGVASGDKVDLFAVSGPEAGSVAPGANLCGSVASVGCVVPLAQSVSVVGVDSTSHTISIAVRPQQVAPWLLLDATEPIWAVPAGAVACEGTEQSISDPYQALRAIQRGTAAPTCSKPIPASGTG